MEEQNLETTQEEISLDTWTNSITDNTIISYGLKIGAGIVVFLILMIVSKVVTRIIRRNIKKHLEETNPAGAGKIAKLLGSIFFWILMLFALFICFEIMGVNIGLLISGVSLGVGLAFKEVLGNMFAGIMILYTKEFKMGDIIEIQTGEGYFGRIEEITIRYTVIRTLDLRQVIIPNMTMISEPIKTFSSEDLVKLNTIIGISYKSDVAKAIEVLKDTINSFDFVKSKENTTVFVLEFGDSSINLKCVFCFDPKCGIIGEVAIGHINERVSKAFKENGINFTYPHVTLNLEDGSESSNKKVTQLFDNEAKAQEGTASTSVITNAPEEVEEPVKFEEPTKVVEEVVEEPTNPVEENNETYLETNNYNEDYNTEVEKPVYESEPEEVVEENVLPQSTETASTEVVNNENIASAETVNTEAPKNNNLGGMYNTYSFEQEQTEGANVQNPEVTQNGGEDNINKGPMDNGNVNNGMYSTNA